MVVASIHGPFGGILDHDCGVRGVVRMLSARREDVSICRSPPRPAFRWRVWRPFNEREPAGVLPRKLAEKKRCQSLLEHQYLAANQRTHRFRICVPSQLPATPSC
jgi:hypothetical protein